MPTFDSVNLTELSESSPRTKAIDTLQIHHATTFDLATLRGLMSAGGRQVSANAAMGPYGELMEVVPINRRAFTSGVPAEDQHSYTVEVCNTSGAPEWGISPEAHERLARLAVELYREGRLGSLTRSHIIGHREVPGTYATACPGPSMNLDWIASRAAQINNPAQRRSNMTTCYVKASTGDKKGGIGSLWAVAGDVGTPCPGNWREFVRTAQMYGDPLFDRAARMAATHGNGIMLSDDEWESFKADYTTPVAAGSPGAPATVVGLTDATIKAVANASAAALLDLQAARLKG